MTGRSWASAVSRELRGYPADQGFRVGGVSDDGEVVFGAVAARLRDGRATPNGIDVRPAPPTAACSHTLDLHEAG